MQIAASSLFNFADQLEARTLRVGRLQHALALNSDRINSSEDPESTPDSDATETLAEFGRFHHAASASLRVNQFISSEFLFDPIQ